MAALDPWRRLSECPLNPGLFGHSVCESNGVLYMFGGSDRNGVFSNVVFSYTIKTGEWQAWDCTGNSPCPRNFHGACIIKDRLYVFGGKSNGYHADLYHLSLSSRAWLQNKFKTKAPLARLYQFSLSSGIWKTLEYESVPPKLQLGRYHHSCTVYQDSLLVFGGKGPDSVLGDLLQFHFDTKTWKVLTPAQGEQCPQPRLGHSAALVGHMLYIYGGRDNVSQFSDTYAYDLKTKRWSIVSAASSSSSSSNSTLSVTAPHHRYFHGAAAYNGSLYYVWGKNIYDFCFSDILRFDIEPPNQGAESPAASKSPTSIRSSDGKKIRLKCQFNEEIRMMSVAETIEYSEFTSRLASEYGNENLRVQYEDDEGDLITIRSAADLEEAFSYFAATNRTASKIFLSIINSHGTPSNSTSSVEGEKGGKRLSGQLKQAPLSRPIRWQPGGLIGEGGFGKVYMGLNLDTGELMAVKQVILSGDALNKQQIEALQREIDLLHDLHHENIVHYLGSEFKDNKLNIFLEYQPGGSIASLVQRFQRLNEKIIRSFARQILSGLDYLHSHGIAHRDIKGANILVDLNGRVKLADFGASKKLADIASFSEGCNTVTGSPYWMAPEVIQQGYAGASYGRKADIWSVGAVIIEMLTGKPPFHSLAPVTALFKIGSSPAVPPTPVGVSPNLADVLRLCFQRDPKARPSADELLRHPFFLEDEDISIIPAKSPPVSSSNRPSESSAQAASVSPTTPSKKRSKASRDKEKEKEKEVRTKKRRSKQLKTSQIVDSLARQQQQDGTGTNNAPSPRGPANAVDSSGKEDSETSQDALNSSEGGISPPSERVKSPRSEQSLGSDSDINSIISFLREKIKQEDHEDVFKL